LLSDIIIPRCQDRQEAQRPRPGGLFLASPAVAALQAIDGDNKRAARALQPAYQGRARGCAGEAPDILQECAQLREMAGTLTHQTGAAKKPMARANSITPPNA
jgi:hypothetical protein